MTKSVLVTYEKYGTLSIYEQPLTCRKQQNCLRFQRIPRLNLHLKGQCFGLVTLTWYFNVVGVRILVPFSPWKNAMSGPVCQTIQLNKQAMITLQEMAVFRK